MYQLEENMPNKYLKYRITTTKAGLKHQSFNLKTLISEAFLTNRIPVISPVSLYGKHNFNKPLESNLSQYFDLENIFLNGQRQQVAYSESIELDAFNIKPEDPIPTDEPFVEKVFPQDEGCSWKFVSSPFDIYYSVVLKYQNEIYQKADQLTEILGNDYACVHVRRGDVLKLFSKKWPLFLDTRPKNILKVLSKNASPKNVYIMSNEKPGFFKFPSTPYRIFLANDFPEIDAIRHIDNYRLFCIESVIMEKAKLRISTFKDNNPLYHDSLSSVSF